MPRLLYVLLLSCALVSCSGEMETKYRIGFSQCSDDAWRTQMNEEMRRELLFHPHISLQIRCADNDSKRQCCDIDSFIAEKVDVLIVSPNEADGLTDAVSRAYDAGIPVIVTDRRVHGDKYTAFIGGDNLQVGHLLADYIRSVLPNGGKIIELRGLESSTPAVLRHEGLLNGLNGTQIRLVAEGQGRWFRQNAYLETKRLLAENISFDLIVAQNDQMALGAWDALYEVQNDNLQTVKHIPILGVDAMSGEGNGLQALLDGKIDVSVVYPPAGDILIDRAVQILNGEPFPRDTILSTALVNRAAAEPLVTISEVIDREVRTVSMLQKRADRLWQEYHHQQILSGLIGLFSVIAVFFFLYMLHLYRQRKRLHEQLMLAQKQLEDATLSKLTFFTNVSHDFRTPLTLIADPLGQLEHDDSISPEQHNLIALAHRNAQVLLRLINQVLDFRKYESGMLQPNWSRVDLNRAIREWTEAFAPLSRRRRTALSFDAPQETIEAVLDVEKTERIVFNLMANAFKFTPENGHVGVKLWREANEACFTVTDTGSGIPEEYKSRIFDTFFQMDATNSYGSGIGLALVRSFVKLQGGIITVADNPAGQGTVFTVRLPIGDPASLEAAQEATTYQRISSYQILTELGTDGAEDVAVNDADNKSVMLVVDDNADIRAYLRTLFSDTYTVITAKNGALGLRKAFISVPDIILCDLSMPDIDGLEVCRQLKSEQVTSHIPVLMLTARSMDEQQIDGYEHGADAYVVKPFKAEILKAQVASLIANRQLISNNELKRKINTEIELQTPEEQFVLRFTELVKERIDDQALSVEYLADKMAMSRTQLYRKIKQLTDFSPNEIIRDIRLNEARVLLKKGKLSVSEVAYKTGFTSPSYFTKVYSEFFGERPSEIKPKG